MKSTSTRPPHRTWRSFIAVAIALATVSVSSSEIARAQSVPSASSSVLPRFATLNDAVQAGALSDSVVVGVRSGRSIRVVTQLNALETSEALTAAAVPESPLRGPALPTDKDSNEIAVTRPGDAVVGSRTAAPLSFDGPVLRQELDRQKTAIRQSVSKALSHRRDFANLPAFAANVDSEAQLLDLVNAPGVGRVSANQVFTPSLAASLPSIGQPAAVAAGLTGVGTYVGVIDSGIDYTRAAFGSCVVPGGSCRVSHLPADFTHNADGSLYSDAQPDDTCATLHGTNVAGIVAGTAPGTKIVGADVFQPLPATATRAYSCANQGAYTDDILEAIDFMVNLKVSGVNIVAVNMSFGGGSRYTSPCADDTQIAYLRSVGIQPIAAAGNAAKLNAAGQPDVTNGTYQDGVMNPACISGVIAVGANFNGGGPTSFSQSAPLQSMIFAPGNAINAAGLTKSGTSMAAPHVAAAFAMVSQARPGWSLERRFQFLQDSSTSIANLYVARAEKSLNMSAWSTMLVAPANDNRSAAAPAPASVTLNGYSATAESGELSHGGVAPTRTVWYRHTMTRQGRFSVETPNLIGLYSNVANAQTSTCVGVTYGNCQRIAGNPGDIVDIAISTQPGTWQMAAKFAETGSTTLHSTINASALTTLTINTQGQPGVPVVQIVDMLGSPSTNPYTAKVIARNAPGSTVVGPFSAPLVGILVGDFPTPVTFDVTDGQPSDNDATSSPFALVEASGTTDHTTVTATPTVGGSFDRDLWYQWVATENGKLVVSTADSNVDTELCLSAPLGQDCSGYAPNLLGTTSIVSVRMNDVVSIRVGVPVDGVAQGTVHLTWRFVSDQRSPATPIPGVPGAGLTRTAAPSATAAAGSAVVTRSAATGAPLKP
jgi:Subtilase family